VKIGMVTLMNIVCEVVKENVERSRRGKKIVDRKQGKPLFSCLGCELHPRK
jgi:hypothetical protein